MEFGKPHHIQSPTLGRIDLREAFLKGVSLGSAGQSRELMKHAEFHGVDLPAIVIWREVSSDGGGQQYDAAHDGGASADDPERVGLEMRDRDVVLAMNAETQSSRRDPNDRAAASAYPIFRLSLAVQ